MGRLLRGGVDRALLEVEFKQFLPLVDGDYVELLDRQAALHEAAALEQQKPYMPYKLKLSLLCDVARGMNFLHRRSPPVIHRDLKSANVLVTNTWRARITDFGNMKERVMFHAEQKTNVAVRGGPSRNASVAGAGLGPRALSDSSQDSNVLVLPTRTIGTWQYMPAEAIVDGTFTRATDVFAMGVLMWETAHQCIPDLIAQEGASTRGPVLTRYAHLLSQGKVLRFDPDLVVPPSFEETAALCMMRQPSARPTFTQLVQTLSAELYALNEGTPDRKAWLELGNASSTL
jgi:serine/threonine protein kinase